VKFEGCSFSTNLCDVVKEKKNKAKVENGKIKSPSVSRKHENMTEEKFPFGEIAPQTLCEGS